MKKIAIIGGLGVGVAHVLAAVKLKNTIHVYDINPDIEEFYSKPIIKNGWGTISDEIKNPGNIKTIVGDSLIDSDYDLIVIATPNATHLHWLKESYEKSKKILIEKPMVDFNQIPELKKFIFDVGNSCNRIYCGFEWLYHPKVALLNCLEDCLYYTQGRKVKKISMVHGYPPIGVRNNCMFGIIDLGVHLLGILKHETLNMPTEDFTVNTLIDIKISQSLYLSQCMLNESDLIVEVGYDEQLNGVDCGIKLFFEDGTIENIAWIPFNFKDLFYRQMDTILNGPTGWNMCSYEHIEILKQLELWYSAAGH